MSNYKPYEQYQNDSFHFLLNYIRVQRYRINFIVTKKIKNICLFHKKTLSLQKIIKKYLIEFLNKLIFYEDYL